MLRSMNEIVMKKKRKKKKIFTSFSKDQKKKNVSEYQNYMNFKFKKRRIFLNRI